ncbi:MAG: FkbM family methyltransferase [Anaerolineales bacterium]|nr:FkbM family methyltransferase [Anaerolineales bacterium]
MTLGKIARYPLHLIPPSWQVPILQGKMRGKKWIVGSMFHGCWLGNFEYEKRILYENTVQPGNIVYDIGAHAGYFTMLSSILVGPEGQVLSFEPHSTRLAYLKKHLELNTIQNVQVFDTIISNVSGSSTVGSEQTPVKMITLDEIVSLTSTRPDIINVDIGRTDKDAECRVLEGARGTLIDYGPTLFLSVNNRTRERCSTFLSDMGYTVEIFTVTTDDMIGKERILATRKLTDTLLG